MLTSTEVSETEDPQLKVHALNSATPEEELELELSIMHRPDAVGNQNVAYLVFGVPGTSSYSFMDLNNLPGDVKVCITVVRGEQEISKSEFSGTLGNSPQAVSGA